MRFLARLRSLGRGVFRRARMERDLDEELQGYFEELVARKEAGGLAPDEARRAARVEMGGALPLKMAVRESWLVSAWDAVFQDVRQAWRGLRATPGPSGLAVVTFALGIGSAS
ncbi:MAG TPA: permease prefix domain 1-containing protein, partial [Planctomycetota bacterium]|nr:permease prefix domain 1-containing protein [Planctomycetota bacterium]